MNTMTIYTATGCARCKIVKQFMDEQGVSYEEKDMKAEGKADFQKFYSANRLFVYRGAEGIEFPIITDGLFIRQGIGAAIAYLNFGEKLDGFFSVGTLHKEWVDGLHISGGKSEQGEAFLSVLRTLKQANMKLQFDTHGYNADILERIIAENLASVVIMEVQGSPELYGKIFGQAVDKTEIEKSMALVAQAPEYRFQSTIFPVTEDGNTRYVTPAEVGGAAQWLETVTQSKKNSFLIRLTRDEKGKGENLGKMEPLPVSNLLSYRTAARRYQVHAEVEKE